MDNELIKQCEKVAEVWATDSVFDAETQASVKKMLENEDKLNSLTVFTRLWNSVQVDLEVSWVQVLTE